MKLSNQSHFSQVPRADIQRSSFDRSHGYKTTFDAGLLIPFFVDEALPGDTFNLSATIFARLATPLKPVMDNMYLETFFFAVPNRLLWENWQKFNGEKQNPDDSTDFLILTVSASGNFSPLSMPDYFGIPLTVIPNTTGINALHFRAYNLIWNEWFRDQNLQDSLPVPINDGPDNFQNNYANLQRRGKRHDYFTSCLPWPQKGEAVEIPLGGFAPVEPTDAPSFLWGSIVSGLHSTAGGDGATAGAHVGLDTPLGGNEGALATWIDPGLVANLEEATAVTINQFREAFQIQKLYERDARGGTRYTEIIKSHFGVTSPDSRLQRPEYLGGGSTAINITMVPQTSGTLTDPHPEDDTPQGNLAGYGTASGGGHSFTKSFTEHCVIIGLMCVRADLTYQQGLNRMWSRQTRWDYYWPALSHLGEQAVLNKEIYADSSEADDDVFGYQEIHAEYRYKPSQITGKFRSNDPQSLDVWHLSQDFDNLPTLSGTFIEENPPIDRVIAVPSEPHFLFDSYIKLNCARPMPTYAVPGMIDHF